MKDKLEALLKDGSAKIQAAQTENELQEVKGALLGKQGSITELLKELPKLDVSLRPEMGKAVNNVKNLLTEQIEGRREELKLKASEISPDFDYTIPGIMPKIGGLHPITQMCYDLNDAFRSMGFEIFGGPEITSEYYAFDNLNFPPNHPARESMDTYWLEGADSGEANEKLCLRPHLTGDSVRYMMTHKPPYRFVYPGRVYRNETLNARKNNFFHQIEGLYVDKNVTFGDLKGVLNEFIRSYFGSARPTRFRSSFFPFTEPSVEVDISCKICAGKGCNVCKGTGWIEVLGAGMVHPNVLRMSGFDPEVYSGFAFGIGVERIAMLKYGIDDIRHFYSNDIRFLKQFERHEG